MHLLHSFVKLLIVQLCVLCIVCGEDAEGHLINDMAKHVHHWMFYHQDDVDVQIQTQAVKIIYNLCLIQPKRVAGILDSVACKYTYSFFEA